MALAITRDVLLATGGLVQSRRLGRFTSSLWSGKVAVAALAVTVVAALLEASAEVMEALVGLTAAVLVYSVVKYAIRFAAIMRHGEAALADDGNSLRPEHGVVGQAVTREEPPRDRA